MLGEVLFLLQRESPSNSFDSCQMMGSSSCVFGDLEWGFGECRGSRSMRIELRSICRSDCSIL